MTLLYCGVFIKYGALEAYITNAQASASNEVLTIMVYYI